MSFKLELEKDPSLQKPQKVFFVMFGLLFLIAPFYYQPNLGGEGLNIPHNSSLWIVASWIIAAASFLICRSGKIILPRYWFPLALLPLGAIVTSFIADNNNPAEWVVRLSVIFGGYIFLIALYQFQLTSRQIERGLYIILSMGLIAATYGIIQVQNISTIIDIVPRPNVPTAVGIFQQINIQAAVMATVLTLVFYLVSRPAHKSLNPIVILTLLLTATAASYNIAISGSRVGLLSITIALTLLVLGRWKLFKQAKVLFVGVLLASAIGGFLGSEGLSKAQNKFNRAIAEDMGGMQPDIRWSIYEMSWQLYTEAPVFGHGLGSFQKVFQDKRAEQQVAGNYDLGAAPKFSHPHNEIIFWLIEGGSFAIVGILAAALFTFIQLVRIGWQRGFGYAALLVPIVLHTQVELPFYISNIPWFLLLTLLFLVHQPGKQTYSLNRLSRAAQVTIPIFAVGISLIATNTLVQAQVGNAGLVNYFNTGQKDHKYLQASLKSGYFEDYSTFIILRKSMFIGISQNDPRPVYTFAQWTERQLQISPSLIYYRNLAIAYDYTNRLKQRDGIMKIAMDMYSSNEDLTLLKKQFKLRDENPASAARASKASH